MLLYSYFILLSVRYTGTYTVESKLGGHSTGTASEQWPWSWGLMAYGHVTTAEARAQTSDFLITGTKA